MSVKCLDFLLPIAAVYHETIKKTPCSSKSPKSAIVISI